MKCQILPILQEWLEHEMRKPYLKMQLDGDPRNVLILLALKNANSLFSLLFSAGAWLDEAQARAVGEQGLLLLRCYWTLGKISIEKKEPRYPIHPKFHMLFHQFEFLLAPLERGVQWIESPLCDSCQIDESFVGCISRYSRRVSPKQTIWRTWDLYLSSLWSRWKNEKPSQD